MFRGTPNKDIVRSQWDRPLIAHWCSQLERPLSYFGLPGSRILDLIAWKDYLGYCSGVERLRKTNPERQQDLNVHREMLQNVAMEDLESQFQLLRGSIEDIILSGTSVDGEYPALTKMKSGRLLFHYDLVNLDFCGGLGVRNKQGKARRVGAIKTLLERQTSTNFLLIMTLNVRDGLEDELIEYLKGAQRDATTSEVRQILNWYASRGERMREYKLKAMVPLFMRREAEVHEFECISHPPIFYIGDEEAHMVHFTFSLRHRPTNFHVFGAQTDENVVKLPLLTVKEGRLIVAEQQHPGFDQEKNPFHLPFLPDTLRPHLVMPNLPVSPGATS